MYCIGMFYASKYIHDLQLYFIIEAKYFIFSLPFYYHHILGTYHPTPTSNTHDINLRNSDLPNTLNMSTPMLITSVITSLNSHDS